MKRPNSVLAGYGTTVFEVMSALAREHGAINLGQGAPDEPGPAAIRDAAARALFEHSHQYPSMMGLDELRRAVADHSAHHFGVELDWQTEVMVTSGATEALAASFLGLLEPGDEAIVFEPVYDSYVPMIRRAGASAVPVRLDPPSWQLPMAELEAAFSERTKLIVLNSPMNPTGKVWSEAELAELARLITRFDAYAVCDEVYEHLVFDGHRHRSLMARPEVRDRCVRIQSAGKTFSFTGWKIGYVSASPALLAPIAKAHQFLNFTTPPNLQRAIALGLAMDDHYFTGLAASMEGKRNRLRQGLHAAGLEPATCNGTYFLNADFAALPFAGNDFDFCRAITEQAKVAAVPISAFYLEDGPTTVVRFCFCKHDQAIDEACRRLAEWAKQLG